MRLLLNKALTATPKMRYINTYEPVNYSNPL
nr:MAG TPA: hypothetical protein [Bacteriophage sp.]